MKYSKAVKLVKLYDQAMQEDEWEPFEKYLTCCNESDLRQAFGDNQNALLDIVFCGYGNAFDYVSQDFIKQMFKEIDKSDKDWLEDYIVETIYKIADDIFRDQKNAIKHFSKFVNWLYKIRSYIQYCNPQNSRIREQYSYIFIEVYHYMEMEE